MVNLEHTAISSQGQRTVQIRP